MHPIVESLRLLVEGRTVAVLGSAPGDHRIPAGCELVASINGSHAAYGLRRADILILNSWSMQPNTPVRRRIIEALAAFSCRLIVYVDAAGTGQPFPLDLGQEAVFAVSKAERNDLLTWATGADYSQAKGGREVPSTGIFGALLLRKLGGRVRLSGFSLAAGHALGDAETVRQHAEQDALYWSALMPTTTMADLLRAEAKSICPASGRAWADVLAEAPPSSAGEEQGT